MMIKKLLIVICAVVMTACAAEMALCLDIGAYGSFGIGRAFYEMLSLRKDHEMWANPFTTMHMNAGGGVVIDTNCFGEKPFSYRFAAGAERVFSKSNKVETMTSIRLLNTFGFGLVRKEMFRLWAGPQAGIVYVSGWNTNDHYYWIYSNWYSYEYSQGGASLGITIGLNVNMKDYVTLSLETGFRYAIYYGMSTRKFFGNSPFGFIIPYTRSYMLTSSGYEGYAMLSCMYRLQNNKKKTMNNE